MLPVSTRSSQKDPLVYYELVMLVNPPDVEQVRDTTPKLQNVARPNLSDAESRDLESSSISMEIFPYEKRRLRFDQQIVP
jgi:hypothetical protein